MDKSFTWAGYLFWLFVGGLQYIVITLGFLMAWAGGFPVGVLGFDGFMHQIDNWRESPYRDHLAPKFLAMGAIVALLILQFLFVRGIRSTTQTAPTRGRLPLSAAMSLALMLALLTIAEVATLLGWCGHWQETVTLPGPTYFQRGLFFPAPRYGPMGLLLVGLFIAWTTLIRRCSTCSDQATWAIKWGGWMLLICALILVQNGWIPLAQSLQLVQNDNPYVYDVSRNAQIMVIAIANFAAACAGYFLRPRFVAKWRSIAGWVLSTVVTIPILAEAQGASGWRYFYGCIWRVDGYANDSNQAAQQTAILFAWTVLIWTLGSLYRLHKPLSWALRRGQFEDKGICNKCGYDLRGTLLAGRDECPECGAKIAQADAAAPEGLASSGSL